MIDVYVEGLSIDIGRQGENLARNIYFDLSELISTYGEGTATLVHMRPSDQAPYICQTETVGNFAVWIPSNTDTAYAGSGKCELRWVVGETLAKSIVYNTVIAPSISGAEGVPDPYQSWIDSMDEAIADRVNSFKDYATPEMYGAIGDGATDDTTAIQNCINSNPGKTIVLSKKYHVTQTIKTSATDAEKVTLRGIQNSKIIAGDNFEGAWVIDICGTGTRTGLVNTSSTTGAENLIIDTNGVCGGILVEKCHLARIKNCVITNLGEHVGLQIDKPSEGDGINSSDAYVDNIIIVGRNSNTAGCTGMVINGHDNDIRNIRAHYVNVGIVINGSHNRIANAHPVRGAADSGHTVYETSKAFVVNNNFTYLTNCYSDNFAVGVDVKAGMIFYLTNFSLLWWENLNVTHTFIKLEDDGETLASSKVFWGHVKGADLLFKANGTNKGIDGDFHANTFTRNPNCLSGLYIDGSTYVLGTDPLFDRRLSDIKIDDYNYAATEITDLSSIVEGTSGRARFNASTSPTGTAGIYIYECIGDSTRKILNAYYPSNKKRYINSYTGSWTGWEEF